MLRRILRACGRAAGRVASGAVSSASVEAPERVRRLLEQISRSEFGGMKYSETGISYCWIKLPGDRTISAHWYSTGERIELQMSNENWEYVELPHDQWSEMILRHIRFKCRLHQDDKLKGLLDV